MVRFVERGTGYVIEANPRNGAIVRFTNTLVPRVYEAQIGRNGVVILRGVSDTGAVMTSAGQATTTPVENEELSPLILSALPQNIQEIALSASGEDVLYLLPLETGGASVVRSDWNGGKAKNLATLGILGWQMRWPSANRIILAQNYGGGASSAYEIRNGSLEPLLRNMNNLVVLPRAESSALLYSSGNFTLSARVNESANTVTLPLRTTADKCAWAPGTELVAYCAVPQTLPEIDASGKRLRGEAYTADTWWKVDVHTGRAELLYAPDGSSQLDVETPSVDEDGEYIAFINRRDKSLWLLRIAE